MARKAQISDPNDIEVYPTVEGFEVALRIHAERYEGKQYFEIVLRSLDRTCIKSMLLTQSKKNAASRLMDFHAGVCALQHMPIIQAAKSAP